MHRPTLLSFLFSHRFRHRAACRLCGFSVHGFVNGTTCVLRIDGRALQAACEAAGGEAPACAGLQEAVRAARRP